MSNLKKSKIIPILILSISFSFISLPEAYADGDVTWGTFDSPKIGFDIGAGGVPSVIPERVKFEVMDDALVGPGLDKISVEVTSTIDSEGITLLLSNENRNGKIQNDQIVLFRSNALFQIKDTAILSISNVCGKPGFSCDDDKIDSFDGNDSFILAFSETTGTESVPIHLFETGKNTGNFEGKLKFTTDPSVPGIFPETSNLQVNSGDTITVLGISQSITNGIILPVPEDKGGIIVEDLGSITITYVSQNGLTYTSEAIITDPGSGKASGGFPRTGLVVDSSSSKDSSGGGCSGDCGPPTLGLDKNSIRIVEHGFSFNGNPVDVKQFYTPYPLITVNIGEENIAVLKIYEDSGLDNIAHVGIAFGLGKNEYFSDSKATINLDRTVFGTEIKSVYDPENVLDNVKIVTEKTNCSATLDSQCLQVTFYHTFREPLEFNMVSTIVWDQNRNSWQNFYNHGIEITGQSLNPPDEYIGIYKGNLVNIFETGENTAIDKNGNTWTMDREWKRDYVPQSKIDNGMTSHGYDRNHIKFETYKRTQELIAQNKLNEILDGKEIQNNELKESITFYGKFLSRSEDSELQKTIGFEKLRAEELFSIKFGEIEHNH